MIKQCVVCGLDFEAKGRAITCPPKTLRKCRRIRRYASEVKCHKKKSSYQKEER